MAYSQVLWLDTRRSGPANLDGAPNLTDGDWLYGGAYADIYTTVQNGRKGWMPHWSDRLDAETIKMLAVYVKSLGGGS